MLIRFAAVWFFAHAVICLLAIMTIAGVALWVHIQNVRELGPAERDSVARVVSKAKEGGNSWPKR